MGAEGTGPRGVEVLVHPFGPGFGVAAFEESDVVFFVFMPINSRLVIRPFIRLIRGLKKLA